MTGEEIERLAAVHAKLARLYADDRFPATTNYGDLRMFALTAVWVFQVEQPPKGQRWQRVADIMRLNNFRFWQTIALDLPRFEPDPPYGTGKCEAPMVRRGDLCGRTGTTGAHVTDPATGQWRVVSFCSRPEHRAYGRDVFDLERARREAGVFPEPMPNAGGLLPCYLNLNWLGLYRHARESWTPPTVGIRADDWPVATRIVQHTPVTLKVLVGGIPIEDQPLPDAEPAKPAGLRLLTTPAPDRGERR